MSWKSKNIWFKLFHWQKSYEEDGTQNYLIFQPMERYFKQIAGVSRVIVFITGSVKDCLTKELILLKRLIILLLQT